VTVRLEEPPFVGMVLLTGRRWHGIASGIKLRVAYVKIQPEREEPLRSIPSSMIYVVEV
jgi:hypothetical protein